MISNPVLLIGGAGTLGSHLIPILLKSPYVSRIRVLSRGEHRQKLLQDRLNSDRVDFFLGDIRDKDRVRRATQDCESVFNFAAIKSIDRAEYDPEETIKTNIHGTLNVISCCRKEGVKRAVFTSTDKAVAPVNLYGGTKLVAEKLFIQGNIGSHPCRFSCMRYGNVLSSQGSVIEHWNRQSDNLEQLTLTDPDMTRFFISPTQAAQFIYDRWGEMQGGEIFIPKMKATTTFNLMKEFFPTNEFHVTGKRPGEKDHERLISEDEKEYVTDCGAYWVRWPSHPLFPFSRHGDIPQEGEQAYQSQHAPLFKDNELKEMFHGPV